VGKGLIDGGSVDVDFSDCAFYPTSHLSDFKANSVKGKGVSAKQQADFEALPLTAQQSKLADIDAKTGVGKAKTTLAKYKMTIEYTSEKPGIMVTGALTFQ
jgi:hypothetical protein